jgi:hypothetical protein
MAYKYPFIPRELYPAVMYAAKLVREKGAFNQACTIAANYYNVDEDEVRKHLAARSAAGRKGRKHRPLKWFTACVVELVTDDGYPIVSRPTIKRAADALNVPKQFRSESRHGNSYYSHYERNGHALKEYETERDAIAHLREDFKEYKGKIEAEDENYIAMWEEKLSHAEV